MALKHRFEKQGNLFFKYRGQFPLVLFVAVIPVLLFDSNYIVVNAFYWPILFSSVLVSVMGLIIRFITIGKTAKQTSGRNTWGHEAKVLNTTGIYSLMRHPLYLGNFLMWMGIVMYVGNIWFLLLVGIIYWMYYERIVFAEELFLEKEHGDYFLNWSKRIPAFFPSFKQYQSSSIQFSMKTILRREYPGVSALMIAFVYVDFVREWIYVGTPNWNWSYLWIVLIALLISLVLRTLKHYTDVLKEDDRS